MRRTVPLIVGLMVVATLIPSHAQAVLIETSGEALVTNGPLGASFRGQTLENELNSKVFGPLGMEIEFGAIDGATTSVDDMAFEGPALTVITGLGFGSTTPSPKSASGLATSRTTIIARSVRSIFRPTT